MVSTILSIRLNSINSCLASHWSSDNVTSWLCNIGVRDETVSVFSENRITGSVLFGMIHTTNDSSHPFYSLGLDQHDLKCTLKVSEDDIKKIVTEREPLRKMQRREKNL